MTDVRIKPIKPLPEPLPEGEHVLWQGAPAWKAYARRVFQLDKVALYFLVIVGWVAVSAWLNAEDGTTAVLQSLSWAVPPALGVLALLAGIAWLYARTSVYTVTDKRVIVQSGLVLPSAANLPFARIDSADLKTFRDGTGDIELSLSGPRLLYSMLWPNVRLFRVKRPVPVLRALSSPQRVADLLGDALAADQPAGSHAEAERADARPDSRRAAAS